MNTQAAYKILSQIALRKEEGMEISLTVWQSLAAVANGLGLKKQAKIAEAAAQSLLSYDRNQLRFKEFLQGGNSK